MIKLQKIIENKKPIIEEQEGELMIGGYQTKHFDVCPGATALYKDIESKGVDMDVAVRTAKLQDVLFFIEKHVEEEGYDPNPYYGEVAQILGDQIMTMGGMMDLGSEHSYIQGHIDRIQSAVQREEVNEAKNIKVTFRSIAAKNKWMKMQSLKPTDREVVRQEKSSLVLTPDMKDYVSKKNHADLIYQVDMVNEANAISGGKIHKFITGKNLIYKGKKYPDIEFELLGIDNSNQLVNLKVLFPKNIFGQEMKVPFKSIRRGSFIKTDTSKVNEASDYEVYHKSYTSAIDTALEYAKKKGFTTDPEEVADLVGLQSRRPGKGKTTRVSIPLHKNGKPQRAGLQIVVYGMDADSSRPFELTTYIR
jgi:hypothetical protein